MTSMIFGAIYMGHKGIIEHRREKQRTKNYERWEGLRDDYDEQKKISRETRSLDIQRTGTGGYFNDQDDAYFNDRPILTLRDQQEANDARMSWRPQESLDPQYSGVGRRATAAHIPARPSSVHQQEFASHRQFSTPNGYGVTHAQGQQQQPPPPPPEPIHAPRPQMHPMSTTAVPTIHSQRTGAWDEGLPAPLRVSRRSYADYDENGRYRGGSVPALASRTSSLSQQPTYSSGNSGTNTRTPTPPKMQPGSAQTTPFYDQASVSVQPLESHVPGGRMAELIERGY